MMARKLQEVNGTYLVSLPKRWATRLGLRKGAVLTLRERQDGSIVISTVPGEAKEETEVVVTLPANDLKITDVVTGLYLLGYDKVEVRWRTGRFPTVDRERVRGLTRTLAGVEIIDESEEAVSLRCVLDPSSMKPKMILRRMGFLTGKMMQELSVALEDKGLLEPVAASDDDLDRAYFLLVRLLRSALRRPQLAEGFELETTDYLDYRVAAELVESMGDRASNMALAALADSAARRMLSRRSQDISHLGSDVVGSSVEAFISKDRSKADEAKQHIDSLRRKVNPISKDLRIGFGRQASDLAVTFIDGVLESCSNLLDLIGPVDLTSVQTQLGD